MLGGLEGLIADNSHIGSQLLPLEKEKEEKRGAELIRASRASWLRALMALCKAVKHCPDHGFETSSQCEWREEDA